MTEEIIIDGVNVAGCEFYQIEANQLYPKAQYCGSMRNTFCENEPNCYYKQLKRLEQENKKLKSIVNKQWKLLEQCGINSGSELRRAGYIINDFVQLSNTYRSALEEIREYCSRIERGEVIGTQDCLINSIKNIVNYTINEVKND